MKTFVLASSVAALAAGFFMWGSKRALHFKNNKQYVVSQYLRS